MFLLFIQSGKGASNLPHLPDTGFLLLLAALRIAHTFILHRRMSLDVAAGIAAVII
jgi:hypothetical protein